MKKETKKIEKINEKDYEVEAYEYCDTEEKECMNDCFIGGGSTLSDLN